MQYTVHSRHETTVDVPAKTATGVIVMGKMPAAIIELVPIGGVGATVTLTEYAPNDTEAKRLRELYEEGATIELSATRVKGGGQ